MVCKGEALLNEKSTSNRRCRLYWHSFNSMNNSIRKKIEFYCAYQERCHMEVNKKLNKLGVYGDEIDKYLSHLIDKNFLNETRFSENYVRGKFNNNDWGKIKIIQELKSRKISTWNINNALSEICDEDYLKNANLRYSQ